MILYFSTCYLSDQATSNGFDHLNTSLRQYFPHSTVIGCTTAGAIGCQGYQQHSISAISLSVDYFQISYTLYLNPSNLELDHSLQELKATQDQLVESKKMASLGALVAGVAHEINIPVGIGITATSLIVEELKELKKLLDNETLSRKNRDKFLGMIEERGCC